MVSCTIAAAAITVMPPGTSDAARTKPASSKAKEIIAAAPAEPRTTSEKDFGPSGQWSWAGKDPPILLGVHAIRAMDLIRITTSRSNPLLVVDVAADKVRQFLDIYDKNNNPTVTNLTVQRTRTEERREVKESERRCKTRRSPNKK